MNNYYYLDKSDNLENIATNFNPLKQNKRI
jgi:hypothetical protein